MTNADLEPPWRMPARGWADVLRRIWRDLGEKDLSLVAGGVSYYMVLALFPASAAVISLYSLGANDTRLLDMVHALSAIIPQSAADLIGDGLRNLARSASRRGLGVGALTGSLIALYSSVRGMSGMMQALNIAFGQQEGRGYVRFYLTAVALTVMVIAGGLMALALVVALPALLQGAGVNGSARWIGVVLEWPLLILLAVGMLVLIYRFGPDRNEPRWRWASLGVVTATLMWIAGSGGFSLYIYYFGSYNRTYGALGTPLVLLIWMWLSVFVVLFGAELDGEGERQAMQDRQALQDSTPAL